MLIAYGKDTHVLCHEEDHHKRNIEEVRLFAATPSLKCARSVIMTVIDPIAIEHDRFLQMLSWHPSVSSRCVVKNKP